MRYPQFDCPQLHRKFPAAVPWYLVAEAEQIGVGQPLDDFRGQLRRTASEEANTNFLSSALLYRVWTGVVVTITAMRSQLTDPIKIQFIVVDLI